MRTVYAAAVAAMLGAASAQAGAITVFTDRASFDMAAGAGTTLDFEGLGSGLITAMTFSAEPGSPVFSAVGGSPQPRIVVEGENGALTPAGTTDILGFSSYTNPTILKLTFAKPVIAVGVDFVDVETTNINSLTGIDVKADGSYEALAPGIAGNGGKSFLGVTDDTVPFTMVQFYLGTSSDGVGLDDLTYVVDPNAMTPVPLPATAPLLLAGLAGAAALARRRR
jgi:hypothetical protein